jgi:hypothetical protein
MDANSQEYENELFAWESDTNVSSKHARRVERIEPLGASGAPIDSLRDAVAAYWTRLLERVKRRSETAD